MAEAEDLREKQKHDCASHDDEDESETSERPKRKDEPKSQDDKNERKRTSEEMEPLKSEDTPRANPKDFEGLPPTRSSHPLLAPRSTTFMPPSPNFPLSGGDVAQVSSPRMNTFDEEPSSEFFAQMTRSERKRYREKKRRSEVNKGFDDLTSVLLRVKYVHEAYVCIVCLTSS